MTHSARSTKADAPETLSDTVAAAPAAAAHARDNRPTPNQWVTKVAGSRQAMTTLGIPARRIRSVHGSRVAVARSEHGSRVL